jgi:saccharopine dehydrogenase (NAD+, L-lysine-forming)
MPGAETIQLWLRAETRASETRAPLTPPAAGRLVTAGCRVVVERSSRRCFDDRAYQALGCELVPAGAWPEAPAAAYILGLKELPAAPVALRHRHIYFGHAYKGQPGARDLLARFREGGGELLDIEYLCHPDGRRLAAFGYWAGFVGAALALLAWAGQRSGRSPVLPALSPYSGRGALVGAIEQALTPALCREAAPNSLIIGAAGRCGSGAGDLFRALELPFTGWDIEETRDGGPFESILDFSLLVNCVLLQSPLPPFLTPGMLDRAARELQVIADVSCDPGSPHNPLPLYREVTSLAAPAIRLRCAGRPLDLIAIDNLPALLPAESSCDFSAQLLPALLQLAHAGSGPWAQARALFYQHSDQAQET